MLLQVDWPELDVFVTSVTEQWAAAAAVGPAARDVLAKIVDIDVSNEAFPFLAVGACQRAHRHRSRPRAAFPDELFRRARLRDPRARADRGRAMWKAVLAAGAEFGIMPYGTEAMSTLRIEKGHVVIGAEADGRTTADDLGMGNLVSATEELHRPAAAVAAGADGAGPLATRRPRHARQRAAAARREDRRRSRSRAARIRCSGT